MVVRAGFDVGALSWVKSEIDSALQRGVEALASCAASAGEDQAMHLKASQAHLHQVRGALQIIGLEGVTRVVQELESLLADLARDSGACTGEARAVAERVFHAIRAYLDELMVGKPHQPLRLMPAYSALLDARGSGAADPIDLYFPDLSRRAHKAAPSLHPDERKQALREQRTRYQRGLLGFLRGDRAGAQEMRAALETIELVQRAPAQRTFWWVALGFCDALVHEALPPAEQTRLAAKRLCNRIEQQIRLLCEGTQNIAERLMREALYWVAQATRFQELARMMAESVNDVHTAHQDLMHTMDATDAALASQARLNRELQQDLMRVRMLPFASLAERLHGSVRQTAMDLGKSAHLDIRGEAVVLDRSVLERMAAPLEHLLRNAVTHGIESPQARAEAGKPDMGEIRLDVSQEGNEAVITLADDGAGLDTVRISARARELGIPGVESRRSEAEIAELIFVPGLSTANALSGSAGRGIGMDVVKNEVASLGGRIDVSFERGRGTRFSIYLPLTRAVAQAVLVKAAGCTCAIPAVMVEHVMQLRASQLQSPPDEPRPQLEWQERRYAFHELSVLLQLAQPAPASLASPVLLVRSGVNSIALRVDEILASRREIVVKAIGPHIARLKGITGATVLGSGDIVLILNPVELALRASQTAAPLARTLEPQPVPAAVMVVDDSLTVRKFTGRLLERQGYRVLTARDGVEALERLESEAPAVMLVDIEMPRMDGLELTRRVRAEARFAGVAIIMITSRAAEKHERHAAELGVDHYFGKPFKEDELLARIARFTAAGRAPRVVCE